MIKTKCPYLVAIFHISVICYTILHRVIALGNHFIFWKVTTQREEIKKCSANMKEMGKILR